MILLLMLALALALTAPLALAFWRPRSLLNRRDAALALHRAQLAELVRERAEGRIGGPEYFAAKLEVERRLLAEDGAAIAEQNGDARLLLAVTIIALPIAAFALYLPGSTPALPSEPHAAWAERAASYTPYIDALRARLAPLPPNSAAASEGLSLLAQLLAEQAGFITPEALADCRAALASAPAGAAWRAPDAECIDEATGQ